MPSLNSSLNMGQRALSMNQRAMHTSGHNIANQQTEGFSRQQVTTPVSYTHLTLPTKRIV